MDKDDIYLKRARDWIYFDGFVGMTHIGITAILVLPIAFHLNNHPLLFWDQVAAKLAFLGILYLTAQALTFIITKRYFQYYYPKISPAVSPNLPPKLSNQDYWVWWAICYWASICIAIILTTVFLIFPIGNGLALSLNVLMISFIVVVAVVGLTEFILRPFLEWFLIYKSKNYQKRIRNYG